MWSYIFFSTILVACCYSQKIPNIGCSESQINELTNSTYKCIRPLIAHGTNVSTQLLGNVKRDTLKGLCKHLKQFTTCTVNLVDNLSCANETIRKISHDIIASTDAGIEYICANDAEIAHEFFQENGVPCMMATGQPIQKCLVEKAKFMDYEKLLTNPSYENIKQICKIGEPAKKCIIGPLKKAAGCVKRVVEIIEELLDRMHEPLPCGFKRPGSKAKDKKGDDNGSSSNFHFIAIPMVLSILLPFV